MIEDKQLVEQSESRIPRCLLIGQSTYLMELSKWPSYSALI